MRKAIEESRQKLLEAIPEKDFQNQVMSLAETYGWRRVHFRPAQIGGRWMTAQSGDAGFPDTVLVKKGVLIFAELKRQKVKEVEPEQQKWIDDLSMVESIRVHVWRPGDMEEIHRILGSVK